MTPVIVLDGPFQGTYRSLKALLDRTGLTGHARYQSLRKKVIRLSSDADRPRRKQISVTALELDAWLTETTPNALQVLDGPFQGIYPSAAALAERVSLGIGAYERLLDGLLPRRTDPARSRQRPLPLTGVELQAILALPRPRLRVLDGPHAGDYPSRRALRERAATSDSASYDIFTSRLRLLLDDPARCGQRLPSLTAAELDQCLSPTSEVPNARAIRVTGGPHAGEHLSLHALYERAAISNGASYGIFTARVRLLLDDPARCGQRLPSLSAAELDQCLSPISEVPAAARAIRVTGGPHAGEYPSVHALQRHLDDSMSVDYNTFSQRLRAHLRATSGVHQIPLRITADELSALCAAPPPRKPRRGIHTAPVEIVDGPFAGRYHNSIALFDALPLASRSSRESFVTRCASLRHARSLQKYAPLVLTHAQLTAVPSSGRRPVALRVTSGPYAGDYASILRFCQALLPATSLRQAMLSNRVTRLLLRVQHRNESHPLPLITGEEVEELLVPRFWSDQELRAACVDALRRNPEIDAAALRPLIARPHVRPPSLVRLTYHLAEARHDVPAARAA